jgi:uncharacterized RDD family membrane protein YckC
MAAHSYEMTHHELADLGTRLAAWFIDGVIIFSIESIGFFAAREAGFSAGFIIGLAYTWYFLTRNQGQTPGKILMKIRVIKTDGSPISDSDAVIRYIGTIVNYVIFIGWLWALLDDNRQGWHDKMAHTYVVKAE